MSLAIPNTLRSGNILIPRPAKDVFISLIKLFQNTVSSISNPHRDMSLIFALPLETIVNVSTCLGSLIKPVSRVAMAVAGVLAFKSLLLYSPAAFVLAGACISLPATALVGGSALLYFGTATVVSSVAAGTFASAFPSLGIGLVCAGAGWFVLENHDVYQWGIAEMFLSIF